MVWCWAVFTTVDCRFEVHTLATMLLLCLSSLLMPLPKAAAAPPVEMEPFVVDNLLLLKASGDLEYYFCVVYCYFPRKYYCC